MVSPNATALLSAYLHSHHYVSRGKRTPCFWRAAGGRKKQVQLYSKYIYIYINYAYIVESENQCLFKGIDKPLAE
jgi:hypothetical protein